MNRTLLLSSPWKTLCKLWMLARGAASLGGRPAAGGATLRAQRPLGSGLDGRIAGHTLAALIALSVSLLLLASDPGAGDWPMWGGTPDRNMVSPMKGIPTTWDVATKKNVKWMGQLGSQSYGNPVVAGGQVYAGTNNELLPNPKEGGDRSALMCLREAERKFLSQHTNRKL